MIKIAGVEPDIKKISEKYPKESPESTFLNKLSGSSRVYEYSSRDELIFETDLRSNIIHASKELYRARLGFRTFHESKCNEAYWDRREDGGFVLKSGVKPSDGIRDIFKNTRRYATECATAIVIIFYAAVLESFSENLFNKAFSEIILMNWMQMDELMGIATYRRVTDFLPGDCRYFRNPDVNPLTPEWQGENTIDLGDGEYYGHGIGIGSKERIISVLNDNRIEEAQASAYLMETATRPNFVNLYQYWENAMPTVAATPATPATPAAQVLPAAGTTPASAAAVITPATTTAAPTASATAPVPIMAPATVSPPPTASTTTMAPAIPAAVPAAPTVPASAGPASRFIFPHRRASYPVTRS